MATRKGSVVKSTKSYQREVRDSDRKPVSHIELAEFLKIQNRNLQDFVSETKETEMEEQEQDDDMDTDEEEGDGRDDDGGVLESDMESDDDNVSNSSLSSDEL